MCGFIVAAKINLVTDKSFNRALAVISHRGPDQSKVLDSNGFLFGFNRLSIQDLSNLGAQPMQDIEGNILCFNGEIYNFKVLRQQLEEKGCNFFSSSDTEVLLNLINIYGLSASLDMIDGMYAFVYFEKKSKKIYACKDPFGMKPLFFYNNGSDIVFASEIKALMPLTNSRSLNLLGAMNPLFFTGLSSGNRTIFEGIKSLGAGNYIEYCLVTGSFQEKKFFDLCSLVNQNDYFENDKLSKNELSDKFSHILQRSVSSHLVSDAKVGILFSAGLDSSLIAAQASKITNNQLNLFKYQSEDMDDSALADDFSSRINGCLHITKGIDSDLIYRLPHLIYSYETLNKPDGAPLSQVCDNARKNSHKVLLTGDSADELFAGYGSFDAYRINQYIKKRGNFPKIFSLANKILPGIRNSSISSMHHLIAPFDDRFINPFLDFTLFDGERNGQWEECRKAYAFLGDSYKVNSNAFLLDEVRSRLERFMIRSDRVGMANSIELRLPFLSKEMVGFALNVPFNKRSYFSPSLKRRRLVYDKAPLRYAAKKLGVGSNIINRVKVGTPTGSNDHNNLILLGSRLRFYHVSKMFGFSEQRIREFICNVEFPASRFRLHWTFISLEILIRMFICDESPHDIENEFRELLSPR